MFLERQAPRSFPVGFWAASAVVHVVLVGAIVAYANSRALKTVIAAGTPVAFVQKAHAPAAPPGPPPPPPAPKRASHPRPKPVLKPIPIPEVKPIVVPTKPVDPEPVAPTPDPGPSTANGVEGGVPGGTGQAGGVPGGTGPGGGNAEPVKPKNVPMFAIARDVIHQDKPKLSEVFKAAHRGLAPVTGVYRVCVGLDGRVFDVQVVKSVAGADEEIAAGIRSGWEFKPQQVPVCFLYNIPIRIE